MGSFSVAILVIEAFFAIASCNAALTQKTEITYLRWPTFEWGKFAIIIPTMASSNTQNMGAPTAPMSAAHDGVWVLLFIAKDGSPTYILGNCTRGGLRIREFGCLSRTQATFRFESSECVRLTLLLSKHPWLIRPSARPIRHFVSLTGGLSCRPRSKTNVTAC